MGLEQASGDCGRKELLIDVRVPTGSCVGYECFHRLMGWMLVLPRAPVLEMSAPQAHVGYERFHRLRGWT